MKHVVQTITVRISAMVPDTTTAEDLLQADAAVRYSVQAIKQTITSLKEIGLGAIDGVQAVSVSRTVKSTEQEASEDAVFEEIPATGTE